MNIAELHLEFLELCKEVFEEEDLDFSLSDEVEDIEEWDSMNHVQLIVAIEQKYGFKFSGNDLQRFETVSDFLTLILKNKVA